MKCRTSRFFRLPLLSLLAAIIVAPQMSRAQTEILSPIVIPLFKGTIGTGDTSYQKLGIWASLGEGGTPGLFEFDTGGEGFYSAINSLTPWWGTGSTDTGDTFSYTYSSGFVYTGNIVQTSINLYSDRHATAPSLTTANTIRVGQTSQIVDNHTQEILWSSSTQLDQPPIDQTFFGDFGLSLQNNGNSGIVNALAQLTYAGNTHAGFIIHAGPHGDSSGATLQVGLTEDDLSRFPIVFKLTGTGGDFPDTQIPFYPLQLVKGTIVLTDGSQTYEQSVGVTFDTGNQTPVIFDGSVPADFLNGTQLKDGVLLQVTGESETGLATIFQVTANDIEGLNKVDVQSPQNPLNLSINLGLPVFEQYDVIFDLKGGYIGLRAIPEPSTWALLAVSLLILLAISHRKRRGEPGT